MLTEGTLDSVHFERTGTEIEAFETGVVSLIISELRMHKNAHLFHHFLLTWLRSICFLILSQLGVVLNANL